MYETEDIVIDREAASGASREGTGADAGEAGAGASEPAVSARKVEDSGTPTGLLPEELFTEKWRPEAETKHAAKKRKAATPEDT